MFELRYEIQTNVDECFSTRLDFLERNTIFYHLKKIKYPLWKEKSKYCTDTSFFLETQMEKLKIFMETNI